VRKSNKEVALSPSVSLSQSVTAAVPNHIWSCLWIL